MVGEDLQSPAPQPNDDDDVANSSTISLSGNPPLNFKVEVFSGSRIRIE